MNIINLSPNDSISAIANKCNQNFKSLIFDLSKLMKKQSEIDGEVTAQSISNVYDEIMDELPDIVSEQIDSQIRQAYPPVGSYIFISHDPSIDYPETTWEQVDTITTVPVWLRTA